MARHFRTLLSLRTPRNSLTQYRDIGGKPRAFPSEFPSKTRYKHVFFSASDKPSESRQTIEYNRTNITDMSSSNNSTPYCSGALITPIHGALNAAEAAGSAEHATARTTNVASNAFGVQGHQRVVVLSLPSETCTLRLCMERPFLVKNVCTSLTSNPWPIVPA